MEPDADLGTLGFSSIQGMRLIQALETSFGLKLYASELAGRRSLAALVDYLAGQAPEASPVWPPSSMTATSAEAASPTRGERLVFILSAPRSGSTLLRVMLAGHPGLFCPPELHLAGFATLAERAAELDGGRAFLGEGLTRAVMELQGVDAEQASASLTAWTAEGRTVPETYARLLDLAGGRLCVDKSPSYGTDGAVLARLARWFPEARFIFLTRHPGAVMASLVDNRFDRMLGLAAADPWAAAEQTWQTINHNLLAFSATVAPERWRRVAYEDLVRAPEPAMRGLCEFLGLDFDPAMLTPYAGTRMTDGLHAESLGIGDPNFLHHQAIDPALAERWRAQTGRRIEFSPNTAALAASLGYRLAETLPLSPAQQRFFTHHGDAPEWSIVQRVAVETAEPLEPARFAASWRAVLSRHPQLSIRFERAADGWAALAAEPGEFAVEDIDAAHLAPEAWAPMAEETLAAYHRALSVGRWPLLRVGLARRGEGRYEVLWAVHHAIADGATTQLILRDVLAHYHGGTTAIGQAGEFAAYCGTLAERFDAAEQARQKAFWHGHISGRSLILPTDFPENPGASQYAAEREWAVDVYLDREPGGAVTLYEACALALYEALAKWTGAEAVPLAQRYHGRDLGEWGSFPGAVGNLACDYPLVLRTAAARPWAERAQDLRAALATLPRRGTGYEWLAEAGRVPPVESIAPVRLNFQTGFSWRGAGHRATVLSTRTRQPDDWQRPYALDCIARWEGRSGRLLIRYAENLHTPDTIREFAGRWRAGLLACLREGG
ncbi:sulfotransferase [Methylomagnum sp.]